MRLAGIDGCPGGWVLVYAEPDRLDSARAIVATDLCGGLEKLCITLAVIDVPIGLTGEGVTREADRAARKALPGKTSTVFSAPARATLIASDHPEAVAINRAETGVGISVQAWGIVPKIAEVDTVMLSPDPPPLVEGHPEVSFAVAAGAPIPEAKKKSTGKLRRRETLIKLGFPDPDALVAEAREGAKALGCKPGTDDVFDAAIMLWTAARVHRGEHLTYPAPPGRDARGLTMAIHA